LSEYPSIWEEAAENEQKFYNSVNDCLALCAIEFGGLQGFLDFTLPEILYWTNLAILRQESRQHE
jgi:hypothetical protein